MVVQQTFTGNVQPLLAEMQKLAAANASLRAQLQQGATQSKQHHDDLKSQIGEQAKDLVKLAAGYLTIEKGIEFVTGAAREWREEQSALAQVQTQVTKEMVKQVSLAGELNNLAKVRKLLTNVPGATAQQATEAFAGVSQAGPQLSSEMKRQLAAQVARAAPEGVSLSDLGSAAGQIAPILEGKSAEEIAGAAKLFQEKTGVHFSEAVAAKKLAPLLKMQQAGAMTGYETLALGTAAADARMGKTVTAIGEKVTGGFDVSGQAGHGAVAHAKRRQEVAFNKLSPHDRYQLIMSYPATAKLIGDQEGVALINKQNLPQLAADYQANSATAMESSRVALSGDKSGREAIASNKLAADAEKNSREHAEEGKQVARARKVLDDQLIVQGAGSIGWAAAKAAFETTYLGDTVGGSFMSGGRDPVTHAIFNANETAGRRFVEGENFIEGEQKYDPTNGTINKSVQARKEAALAGIADDMTRRKVLEVQEQQLEELKKLNSRPGTATVNNNNQR